MPHGRAHGQLGLVLAAFIGGGHVAWSALVLLGWAQPVINFVFEEALRQGSVAANGLCVAYVSRAKGRSR